MNLEKNYEYPDNYSLKNVPRYIASCSEYTPDAPPRETQKNIGLFLQKDPSPEDSTYGTHFTEYGGIGIAKLDPKYSQTPRDHKHFKCGADIPIPAPVSDLNRRYLVNRNRAFFAQPIPKIGYQVRTVFNKYNTEFEPKPVKLSLFPRSVVYELEFIKNEYRKKMLDALERERNAFSERKRKKIKNEATATQEEQNVDEYSESNQRVQLPPFWYADKSGLEPPTPVGNIDDAYISKHYKMPPKIDFLRELGLDSPANYIPGEVYKNRKEPVQYVKRTQNKEDEINENVEIKNEEECHAFECKTCCSTTGCEHKQVLFDSNPCVDMIKEEAPDSFPYPGEPVRFLSWGDRRQDELFQVGYPFKTLAAKWMKENVDPIRLRMKFKSARRRFPDLNYSNL